MTFQTIINKLVIGQFKDRQSTKAHRAEYQTKSAGGISIYGFQESVFPVGFLIVGGKVELSSVD